MVSRPHIRIKCKDKLMAALVDTGACTTLMDYQVFLDIRNNCEYKLTTSPSLCTLTGTPIDTKGSFHCKLGVGLLIGTDLLKSGWGRIDYYRDSVVLGERHYPFVMAPTPCRG